VFSSLSGEFGCLFEKELDNVWVEQVVVDQLCSEHLLVLGAHRPQLAVQLYVRYAGSSVHALQRTQYWHRELKRLAAERQQSLSYSVNRLLFNATHRRALAVNTLARLVSIGDSVTTTMALMGELADV
jgi:hypothetical protein